MTVAGEALVIPARMLNEWAYCPRLFHLMFVQGVFEASAATVEGAGEHERMRPRTRTKATVPADPPWSTQHLREVTFDDAINGVAGRFDVVAADHDGGLVPVEAKHGPAPDAERRQALCGVTLKPGAWSNDQVQLGAQALLLRAAGAKCDQGVIWYRGSNRSVHLPIDDSLLNATQLALHGARETALGPMPPPLTSSPKCVGCSLATLCMPDETNLLLGRDRAEPRPIVPARRDGGGVYVVSPRARVGKVSESLAITVDDTTSEVSFKDVEHLSVFGTGQVTTQALTALAAEGVSVHFHTTSGRLLASVTPTGSPNLLLRRAQYRCADDSARSLAIARSVVVAKISNQRVLARRNAADVDVALLALQTASERAAHAPDTASLMGFEGDAARRWFDILGRIIGDDAEGPLMTGRSRRPPADPVNAVLSFGYALLVTECVSALRRVGLDPDLGFLHAAVSGRPALALDLMEPFRPLVVDSLALRAFRNGQLTRASFVRVGDGVLLRDAARREVLELFERRMDDLVTHPVFSYRMSYRRVLEVEARMLGRHIQGELSTWTPLVTR